MSEKNNVVSMNEYLQKKESIKQKKLILKKQYYKPKAKCVGIDTQKSPVMGCWDCGEDGIHC